MNKFLIAIFLSFPIISMAAEDNDAAAKISLAKSTIPEESIQSINIIMRQFNPKFMDYLQRSGKLNEFNEIMIYEISKEIAKKLTLSEIKEVHACSNISGAKKIRAAMEETLKPGNDSLSKNPRLIELMKDAPID